MSDWIPKSPPKGLPYVRKAEDGSFQYQYTSTDGTFTSIPADQAVQSYLEGGGRRLVPLPSDIDGYVRSEEEGTFAAGEAAAEPVRLPFVLTCQTWMEQNRYIFCRVNPASITWSIPLRSSIEKMRAGEVQHVWKDPIRNTFYDEPRLTIAFQSGNIMPIRWSPETRQPVIPQGLDNFYAFMALLNEKKIQDNGETNQVYILYNSRIFPSMTLSGMFSPDGLSFSDNSGEPNMVNDWSATFTVYHSFPEISDYTTLRATFIAAGFGRVA